MIKILRQTPYARRLRLVSREVVATLILTVLALAFIVAAVNGPNVHQAKASDQSALILGAHNEK